MPPTRDYVLLETLQLAVPMHIDELRHNTVEQRQQITRSAAQVIAHQGDILMFGGSRNGETAGVFNALARGLAAAAYQPGGVDFAGLHWCTDHAACVHAAPIELYSRRLPRPRPIVDLELPA